VAAFVGVEWWHYGGAGFQEREREKKKWRLKARGRRRRVKWVHDLNPN